VEKLLRRTIGEDIALRINLSAEPYPVYADPGRLEQVLLNLAVNARDAMPTGGVLSIETDALAVDEYFAAHHPGVRPGSYLRLRVSDTGVGMRKETVDRAFEPFFTTKPKGQGTGLGLATIYGIITQAGGHAELYSEPGAGTTFSALLPITDAAASSGAPAAVPPGRGAGQRILLVEDNDSLRELTERILQRAGYTVLAAANGADAQRLADAPPGLDLLLTDVVLPDLHGPAVYELIRTAHPDVRVVFMSGYAETILAERSTVPVGATVLNKPVSGHQLLSTVERALAAERRAGQDAS
jgi:CheY-like chemotaxis protein